MRGRPSEERATPLLQLPNFLQSSSQDIRPNCLGAPLSSLPPLAGTGTAPGLSSSSSSRKSERACLRSALFIFAEQGERGSDSERRMRLGREIPNRPMRDQTNKRGGLHPILCLGSRPELELDGRGWSLLPCLCTYSTCPIKCYLCHPAAEPDKLGYCFDFVSGSASGMVKLA